MSILSGIVMTFFFSGALAQTDCSASIVLLGDNAQQATDSSLREHISNDLGFSLDYMGAEEALPEDILAGGYNLVIISNSLSSSTAETYVDLEVPIINLEGWALDGLNMTLGWDDSDIKAYNNMPYANNEENSFNSFIVNGGDSVTAKGLDAGYAGDTIPVFTADVPYQNNQHPAYLGIPNENAYTILEYTEDAMIWLAENDPEICGTDYCLEKKRYGAFVYEKGVEMENGFVAPEKRGFYFFHTHTAAVVTSEVWDIFDAMVYWGLGCLDRPASATGTDEFSEVSSGLTVYPNPSSGSVKIHFNGSAESELDISIYDLLGKKLFESQINHLQRKSLEVDIEDPGIYLLKAFDRASRSTEIKKIVIQK